MVLVPTCIPTVSLAARKERQRKQHHRRPWKHWQQSRHGKNAMDRISERVVGSERVVATLRVSLPTPLSTVLRLKWARAPRRRAPWRGRWLVLEFCSECHGRWCSFREIIEKVAWESLVSGHSNHLHRVAGPSLRLSHLPEVSLAVRAV